MPQVQLFDLIDISWPFPWKHNMVASPPPNPAASLSCVTDEIVGTYCGIAPGFDRKAKLSLSESVELAPESQK